MIWRQDWTQMKADIALKLNEGECGGSYGEAILILCTAISALSSDLWPGEGKDRARFVEAMVRFLPGIQEPGLISVPLLVRSYDEGGDSSTADALGKKFMNYPFARVLTGDDVDRDDDDILAHFPELELSFLREHSYACLLYKEIRSSYAHEYRPSRKADSWSMTSTRGNAVSYTNMMEDPHRHIHFHIDWVASVAVELGLAVDNISESLPHSEPDLWWLHGSN